MNTQNKQQSVNLIMAKLTPIFFELMAALEVETTPPKRNIYSEGNVIRGVFKDTLPLPGKQ
jgi:hypothetical protein